METCSWYPQNTVRTGHDVYPRCELKHEEMSSETSINQAYVSVYVNERRVHPYNVLGELDHQDLGGGKSRQQNSRSRRDTSFFLRMSRWPDQVKHRLAQVFDSRETSRSQAASSTPHQSPHSIVRRRSTPPLLSSSVPTTSPLHHSSSLQSAFHQTRAETVPNLNNLWPSDQSFVLSSPLSALVSTLPEIRVEKNWQHPSDLSNSIHQHPK